VKEKEFKKFTDRYIGEMIEHEKEVGEKVFYEKMDSIQRMRYDSQKKREEDKAAIVKFFVKCNWFEKFCFLIAQVSACILPFSLLATLKSAWAGYFSLGLWITCAIMLLLLRLSKARRTGEKLKILFLPMLKG
jgi:hypothetical protein